MHFLGHKVIDTEPASVTSISARHSYVSTRCSRLRTQHVVVLKHTRAEGCKLPGACFTTLTCRLIISTLSVTVLPAAGGGNGWGTRLFGAAVDNVVSMEVVLATEGGCSLTQVDHLTHAELFAGLKGAGAWGETPTCLGRSST